MPTAVANAANTLRVVSVARASGTVDIVVSVPTRLASAASGAGAFTVDGPNGQPVTPTVTALAPSSAAVAIVIDLADGSSPELAAKVAGTAAELIRSLEPDVAAAVVSTRGAGVLVPLTTDRSAALAALARPPVEAAPALAAAMDAATALFADHAHVDPMIVVINTAAGLAPVAPSPGGVTLRTIPVAGTVDPVSLADEANGLLQGRFRLSEPDPGDGPLAIHLRRGADSLDATATLSSPAPAATSTSPPTVAGAAIIPVATTPLAAVGPVAGAVPAAGGGARSGFVWMAVLGGLGVTLVAGGALAVRRRRRDVVDDPWAPTPLATPAPATPAPKPPRAPLVAGYYYTDFTDPFEPVRPSEVRRPVSVTAGDPPTRTNVAAPVVASCNTNADKDAEPSVNGAMSPDEVYARRLQVLRLADELGNISEACRIVGVSRRSFYEWKRTADKYGVEALYPKRR